MQIKFNRNGILNIIKKGTFTQWNTLIRSADWVVRQSDKTKGLQDDDDISNLTEIATSIPFLMLCVYSKLYHNLYKYCARTPSFLPLPTESAVQYPMKSRHEQANDEEKSR